MAPDKLLGSGGNGLGLEQSMTGEVLEIIVLFLVAITAIKSEETGIFSKSSNL